MWGKEILYMAVPKVFGTRDCFHGRQLFHGTGKGGGRGWFQDDPNPLNLLCTLFLLLPHQLHLGLSSITSQRWGIHDLFNSQSSRLSLVLTPCRSDSPLCFLLCGTVSHIVIYHRSYMVVISLIRCQLYIPRALRSAYT